MKIVRSTIFIGRGDKIIDIMFRSLYKKVMNYKVIYHSRSVIFYINFTPTLDHIKNLW